MHLKLVLLKLDEIKNIIIVDKRIFINRKGKVKILFLNILGSLIRNFKEKYYFK